MRCFLCLVLALATASTCTAVTINMDASVTLGRKALQKLASFLDSSKIFRRSGFQEQTSEPSIPDKIREAVDTAKLGFGLEIFENNKTILVNDFIIDTAIALEGILAPVIPRALYEFVIETNRRRRRRAAHIFFVKKGGELFNYFSHLLKVAEEETSKDNQYEWVTVIKKTGARLQTEALQFAEQHLHGDNAIEKKKVIQKIVTAVVLLENKYENILCKDHNICDKGYVVTKNFDNLLQELNSTSVEREKEFIKSFYDKILNSPLSFLSSETILELHVILSDFIHSDNAPMKTVMSSFHNAVRGRLNYLQGHGDFPVAYDLQFVNAILSDMDYFYYSPRETFPFDKFMLNFNNYIKRGGKFDFELQTLMNELSDKISSQSKDLIDKLRYRIKVFLELTIDQD